jgi:cation transport regulator
MGFALLKPSYVVNGSAPKGDPTMPYDTNEDLPDSVARHLPPHAQDIYRAAFNHAFAAHTRDPRQEEAAHRIAWAAVKRSYVKVGDSWVARQDDA